MIGFCFNFEIIFFFKEVRTLFLGKGGSVMYHLNESILNSSILGLLLF